MEPSVGNFIIGIMKVHFSQLYNANVDDTAKTKLHSSISSVLESSCFSDITVTIDDIVDACAKQKCGKAAGPDGIDMEVCCLEVIVCVYTCVCSLI